MTGIPPPITHLKGPMFRLDEYALKILRKGCPLENTVAFVDGSHVPGILLETQSLYEKGIPFLYLLFK